MRIDKMRLPYALQALFTMAYLLLDGAATGNVAMNGKTISLPLWNVWDGKAYATNITLGSNKNTATVVLDTTTGHSWINPVCPTSGGPEGCRSSTLYDPDKSTTAKHYNGPDVFDEYSVFYDKNSGISVGNGNGWIKGHYYADDIGLGQDSVPLVTNFTFAVAEGPRDLEFGQLGIGPSSSTPGYGLLVEVLTEQDHIGSMAFGLKVPPRGNSKGSLTFGGFDSKKYKCNLEKVPVTFDDTYMISLDGIGQTREGEAPKTYDSESFNSPFLKMRLLTSNLYNLLPDDIFHAIGRDFPSAKFIDNAEPDKRYYMASCDPPAGTVDLRFRNKTISIPYRDFVVKDPAGTCWLKIATVKGKEYVLAESFARATYLVFDNHNNELWIDQADDCGTHIVPFEINGIPGVGGCQCGNSSTGPGPGGFTQNLPPKQGIATGPFSASLALVFFMALLVTTAVLA